MVRVTVGLLVVIMGAFISDDEQAKEAPAKNEQLRKELLQRVEVDQQARGELVKWMTKHQGQSGADGSMTLTPEQQAEFQKIAARVKEADDANTKWLRAVVEKQGWPTITHVGEDGAHAAWLLVQHADADPKFQRQCLDLMTKLPKDQVKGKDLAYLTDRVLLAEGKKQIYGTQFNLVDGKWIPRSLEDEANVDKRRAELGLPPLAEYIEQLKKAYSSGSNKK